MSNLTIAGFDLFEQLVGKPVDSNIEAKPGIIVMQDKNTKQYAVSDTPDLAGTLALLTQGQGFNKVFINKYHKNTAENVRIFYRPITANHQRSEFELTRSNCRMALLGELAPLGQNEATHKKLTSLAVQNRKYYDWLCSKIPCLTERMERFNVCC